MPSAYVFPGGTVRDDDHAALDEDVTPLSERSDTPVDHATAVALYACAIRELFEEAGVLLVRDHDQQRLLSVQEADLALEERLESLRLALQARQTSLAELLSDYGWRPALDLLVPFSHWITPRALATRFDTRFFVAELPIGQTALHDTIETSEGVWRTPKQLLSGDYHTVYATAQHLRRLAAFRNVQSLMAFARTKPIRMVSPALKESTRGLEASLPADLEGAW
jgi:8-oxo-dGTP pyrophosphatase MutT (NUDIX family)